MWFTVWEESEGTMGSLAGYLQESFIRSCPQESTCAREVQVLGVAVSESVTLSGGEY